MGDYPDPDEEFELMYGDDLEALRDHEEEEYQAGPSKIARKSLDFSTPAVQKTIGIKASTSTARVSSHNISLDDNIVEEATDVFNLSGIENLPASQPSSQKRNIEDLFGDIEDLDYDIECLGQVSKKTKYESEEQRDLAMIEKILVERQRKIKINNPISLLGKDYVGKNLRENINNISTTIPRWPFIPVTKSNGERVYVRFHDEAYMERELDEITKSHEGFKSMLNDTYKNDWKKATEYLENKATQNQINTEENLMTDLESLDQLQDENQNTMWVERYKPMRYVELLSDESTNRVLLQWLKMWDKVVFNKEIKIKNTDINSKFNKRSGKFEFGAKRKFIPKNVQELSLELDEHNRPKFKVALLCGPPGCGKTTLAHLIAKHAGYKPVEINASDDRSVEAFKLALENATQMKSVLDEERKPNCLILDEIDGAPLPAVEFLVKFISGTITEKVKKGQKAKVNILKRPVICICNDVYTSSLRPLRQSAFVVHFPPTQNSRLVQRLSEVTINEGLKVDLSVLTALGEKTHNDVRSCLGVLHFCKAKGKQIKLSDVLSFNIGQKDMNKGLFQVWQEIFQIQLPKHQRMEDHSSINSRKNNDDANTYDASLRSRSKKILGVVQSFGDYERLMQGVYENFLDMKMRDSLLLGISHAMDWFITNDLFNTFINTNQNYMLMPYLPHAFVCWHFLFAGLNWPKIKFPNQNFEMYQRQNQLSGITIGVEKGMNPQTKPFISKNVLVMDLLPMLPHIISPALRPVNIQLYSKKEKLEMNTVVGVMLDYGLQYVQERSEDGTYNYVLDPHINQIAIFDEKISLLRNLTYAMKQLISREVDLEKIKRNELKVSKTDNPAKKMRPIENVQQPPKPTTPNHLVRLQPKSFREVSLVSKDFFGRTVTCTPKTAARKAGNVDDIVKSPIWYHYKEGFNNAVRRDVKMDDLF